MVLQQFWQAVLKLKPSKCHFFESQVTFLGHVLTPEGVLPDLDNVEKFKLWPVPTCFTDVQAILDMGNYYWQFINHKVKEDAAPYPVDKEGKEL